MERNTMTIAGCLQAGDRFYKAADKEKKVFQMIQHKTTVTQWQTYKYWCLPAGIADRNPNENTVARFAEAIKRDTQVVFLRNINNNQ